MDYGRRNQLMNYIAALSVKDIAIERCRESVAESKRAGYTLASFDSEGTIECHNQIVTYRWDYYCCGGREEESEYFPLAVFYGMQDAFEYFTKRRVDARVEAAFAKAAEEEKKRQFKIEAKELAEQRERAKLAELLEKYGKP